MKRSVIFSLLIILAVGILHGCKPEPEPQELSLEEYLEVRWQINDEFDAIWEKHFPSIEKLNSWYSYPRWLKIFQFQALTRKAAKIACKKLGISYKSFDLSHGKHGTLGLTYSQEINKMRTFPETYFHFLNYASTKMGGGNLRRSVYFLR